MLLASLSRWSRAVCTGGRNLKYPCPSNAEMTTNAKLILSLLAVSLGAGCAGSGPNTTQGAVGGAAAGALLGGIIGNNRAGGNGASGAAIGAVAGGVAGAAMGNSLDHD